MSGQKGMLLEALVKSGVWCSAVELISRLGVVSSVASVRLRELVDEGLVQRAKPAPGAFKGAVWIYAAAGVPLLDAGDAGAGGKLARLPPKVRGFRAEAKARWRLERAQKKKKGVVSASPVVRAGVGTPVPARSWALTNDGVLLDLQSGAELSLGKARELVDFVSVLRDKAFSA